MNEEILTIIKNEKLNDSTYRLVLGGMKSVPKAGQFVEVQLESHFLRRPFGVADFCNGELTLLYRVVGIGTSNMTKLPIGTKLNVLVNLGNGFSLDAKKPVLISGGIGLAPLYYLAKQFYEKGIKPKVILGFKNKSEVIFVEEFERIADVIIATDDGSVGFHGNSVSAFKTLSDYDCFYACGPMVMMKALCDFSTDGYVSLEARMGCGFGACMGCSIKTTAGFKRVCKEGPVFSAKEVIYE